MAVEILKQGNLHEDFVLRADCKTCGSTLAVLARDTDSYYREHYSGDYREPFGAYDRLACDCPVCGARVLLAETDALPAVVKRMHLPRVRKV